MDNISLYRSLFLMDDTRNFTNEFYISEFVKIVLFEEGCFKLSLEEIHNKIEQLTSLEYTEADIEKALSIWNKGEVDIEGDYYSLSSVGEERISKHKKASNLNIYVDLFLKNFPDKYRMTKNGIVSLLERFIYQRFNENLKQISDILNHCLNIDECDKKYDEQEKEIINDFLEWDNDGKNACVFRLIAKAYDYCMINSKCQVQKVDFSKINFYLDTNIVFRLMGINGFERKSSVKSLIEKCRSVGINLFVSNYVIDECDYTIQSQLQILIDSTKSMNKLLPPSTMSFAEEKSVKQDFYRRYYDWIKAGNNHRNYDGFKKCVMNEFKELIDTFNKDTENPSFKVKLASDFKAYCDSLYIDKMDKNTTETDVNSFMLILEKRKNTDDENEYFLISADQTFVSWARDVFPGHKSIVDFPSAWLSIILKYIGREKESDYKAFCQFIHLSIEPQIDDLEKKIAIKTRIMQTDIDDDIKAMMIEEVRDNFGQYKNYTPDNIVHAAYAKTKESIETETINKKEQEFGDRILAIQKAYDKQFEEQQKTIDNIVAETENATIDAYNRGRQDATNEYKQEISMGKIEKTIKRNKTIRRFIKIAACSVIGATLISWILLGVLGYIKDGSKLARFYENHGMFLNGICTLSSVFFMVFDMNSVKEKLFPVNKEIIESRYN